LNGQESAEAIVPRRKKKELREGLNVERSLNFARLESNAMKAANPDTRGNYQREVGVELRGNAGEPSIASASAGGEDGKAADTSTMLEKVLTRENLNRAYKRVVKNGGSPGVDGMTVEELLPFLKRHGESLRQQVLAGEYQPQPVRRVEIPKADGGRRPLGIPTAVDRVIQQAIAQVLTPLLEKEFSGHSYGFRPGRSAHQAIRQAQAYIQEGSRIVVDIDLENFFDRVNHDKLMSLLAKRIADQRVLRLIRQYLEAGVMTGGLVSATDEGTPQGGPLSPLLSNVVLHELDKELEKRGHRFCRYADDCNIYVRSWRAGKRVMAGISQFLEKRLQLKVNRNKSAVDSPTKRKFLGISFYYKTGGVGIRVHPKPIARLKEKVRAVTMPGNARSMAQRVAKLNAVIRGWVNYFKVADMRQHCADVDDWMRRRLRLCYWEQWKNIKTRHDNLVKLGVSDSEAWQYANTRKGSWRIAKSPILNRTLTNDFFCKLGLTYLSDVYCKS
jgi:RNA-directed DNA polymerase